MNVSPLSWHRPYRGKGCSVCVRSRWCAGTTICLTFIEGMNVTFWHREYEAPILESEMQAGIEHFNSRMRFSD